ncbi:4-amino-4-deoxychorismate lyase [Dysgonomonas alginatilytica]|uniref:4-amino-4-deoxychorismate lyase n=1 Tax=Dysgonomonas alginatilytica TaxID=1605892 RepID=A0A2V3PVL0_9BACT|nr:aminotransferase class IV [Dysgonomonas alginatilytica]PXV68946.1 4-amino-4-deoxychorismate lyase [Dysgonomonas alginatilytica]
MNKPLLFVESIKVKDGVFYNLPLHIARLNRTAMHFFGSAPVLKLLEDMIPEALKVGLVKCRVTYGSQIVSIEFEPYVFRRISSLTLVEGNAIDYTYKSADRSALNTLFSRKATGDDILIVKNGLIADTSFANVVFRNSKGFFTPKSYLLGGTKRQYLLGKGIIRETDISVDDLSSFSKIYLINAMIDLEDEICIMISDLKTL